MTGDEDVIFLCEDLRVAKCINGIVSDSKRDFAKKFWATSWYGGNRLVESVNFSSLHDRRVVFIPAINKDSYATTASLVEKLCANVNVREFKIVNQAVVSCPMGSDVPEKAHGLTCPWERYLLQNAVDLGEHESIILKTLAEKAMTLDKFKVWGVMVGIIEPNGTSETEYKPKFSSLASLRSNAPMGDGQGPTTSCFGEYENTTVLYGERSSGKSMLALGVACARAAGVGFLGFAPIVPTKVLFIDGETSATVFRERLERTISALKCDDSLIHNNLHLDLICAEQQSKVIDLNDGHFRRECVAQIVKNNIKLVIFDNLISLIPGLGRPNSANEWEVFWQWLMELEKEYQVGSLLLHHNNANDQAAGTKNIERQCKTLIFVEGGEQLRSKIKKNPEEGNNKLFEPYASCHGALLRVEFKKCKFFSDEIKPFGGFLERAATTPDNPQAAMSGPPWQMVGSPLADPQSLSADLNDASIYKQKYPDLTNDQTKVLEFANGCPKFIRKDIEELLGYARDKAGQVITSLVKKKMLDGMGKGRATKYALRTEVRI